MSRAGSAEASPTSPLSVDLRARVATTTAWREASTAGRRSTPRSRSRASAPDDIVERDRRRPTDHRDRGRIRPTTSRRWRPRRCARSAICPAVAVPLSDVLLRPGDVFAPGVGRRPAGHRGLSLGLHDGSRRCRARGARAARIRVGGDLPPGQPGDRDRERCAGHPGGGRGGHRHDAIVRGDGHPPDASRGAEGRCRVREGPRPATRSVERDGPSRGASLRARRGAAVQGRGPWGRRRPRPGERGRAEADRDEPDHRPRRSIRSSSGHGPISVCEPGVLVIGLLGGSTEEVERRVLEDSAALGATTWRLGPEGPAADLGEIAQLPLVLHPLQALALGIAVERGLDPDQPRHLGQGRRPLGELIAFPASAGRSGCADPV